MSPNAECALDHVRFRAAMHPILNYVESWTNHEPYMVHGVVHGGFRIKTITEPEMIWKK